MAKSLFCHVEDCPEDLASLALSAKGTPPETKNAVICHSAGGKGYCLADEGFSTGKHEFKFKIVKETKGNEGTCIGVSVGNSINFSHR